MIIFLIFMITAAILCVLGIIYSGIQIRRVNRVYTIRTKWVDTMQLARWDKYSFEDMLKRNKSTWYGLKMPKEEDFK